MKIFLDANVLFTAAYNPKGKAFLLIESLHKLIFTSDYAEDEARRNLRAKNPKALLTLNEILKKIEIVPTAVSNICPIDLPLKDQPIFLTALAWKATHLLTGDKKDFGKFMNKKNSTCEILIQTVSDFLENY